MKLSNPRNTNSDQTDRGIKPLMASVLVTLACAGTALAQDPAVNAPSGSDGHQVRVVTGWDAMLEQWRLRSAEGLRLTDIEGYDNNGEAGYVATWEESDDEDYLWRAETWAELRTKTLELASHELRLVDVEIFLEQGEAHYLGVWRSGNGNFALWTCPTWDAFTDKWQALYMSGLQLIDIEVYRDQGATHYFGLFRSDISEEELWKDEDWDEISQ